VKDASLRQTLQWGVGLHHAGLSEPDRKLVEALFVAQKIQVLVATSTLAWGVNTPAHLVIIKVRGWGGGGEREGGEREGVGDKEGMGFEVGVGEEFGAE
jgi:replicative superfamily II helicase